MKQEDKELLLKDLCGRLPYGVKVKVTYYYDDGETITDNFILNEIDTRCSQNLYWIGGDQPRKAGIGNGVSSFATCSDDDDEVVKPYLFPLSSMTEEQIKEYYEVIRPAIEDSLDERQEWRHLQELSPTEEECPITLKDMRCDIVSVNWMLERHFDINGLIEKGLAIDATGLDIYKEETK